MATSARRRAPRSAAALVAAALLTTGLAGLPPAAAAARPDLSVSATTTPATTRVGEQVRVTATVRNVGRAGAASSTTRFYLSTDATWSRGDRALGSRPTRALAAGAEQVVVLTATTPDLPARGYRVIACADAKRKVAEAREGNNCRASSRTVRVSSAGSGEGGDFLREPAPFPAVTPRLETDRSASAMAMPHQQTRLTTTATDGTTYTLVLPPDALLQPATLTMTPVGQVEDLPLSGGLRAAVELRPHGLMLTRPATLTVDSPNLGPVAAQIPFSFHSAGDDLHLYPVLPAGAGEGADTLRTSVAHLATYGVGSGTAADLAAFDAHPTRRAVGQLEAALARSSWQARASRSRAGARSAPTDQPVAHLESYFDQVVRSEIAAADRDPRRAASAVASVLHWSQQAQLVGVTEADTDRHDEATRAVQRLFRALMDAAWRWCVDDHDRAAVAYLFSSSRMAAILDLDWADLAADRFARCSHYEVRLDSVVTRDESWSNQMSSGQSHGRWRALSRTTVDWQGVGRGDLAHSQHEFSGTTTTQQAGGGTCTSTATDAGVEPGALTAYAVTQFDVNLVQVKEGPPDPPVVDWAVTVTPVGPRELIRRTSCDGSSSTDKESYWHAAWTRLHGTDLVVARAADQDGEFLLSERWRRSGTEGTVTLTEDTLLELVHTPLG